MRLLPLAVLLPLVLTACSDDERPTAVPSPSASASPSAPPSTSPIAAPSPSPSLAGIASSATVPLPSPGLTVVLAGDGIDLLRRVLVFGTPLDVARPELERSLGRPTGEEVTDQVAGCDSEDVRLVDWSGGGLQVQFGTPEGGREQVLLSWTLRARGEGAPRARALVGDVATFSFGPGTTVAQLREGLGETLSLSEGDELVAPGFRVADQSGGFTGELTGTGPGDRVELVRAGEGCE